MALLIDLIKFALILVAIDILAVVGPFLIEIFLFFLAILAGFALVAFIGYVIFCAFRDYEH